MKRFVRLDVSLEMSAICVVSEHGKIVREAQSASEPEALACWIGDLDGTIAVVGPEVGTLSQWLHRGMTEAGLSVVLTETWQVKGALKAMPIKTNRRDAEGIARRFCRKLFVEMQGADNCLGFSRQSDRTAEMGEALV